MRSFSNSRHQLWNFPGTSGYGISISLFEVLFLTPPLCSCFRKISLCSIRFLQPQIRELRLTPNLLQLALFQPRKIFILDGVPWLKLGFWPCQKPVIAPPQALEWRELVSSSKKDATAMCSRRTIKNLGEATLPRCHIIRLSHHAFPPRS